MPAWAAEVTVSPAERAERSTTSARRRCASMARSRLCLAKAAWAAISSGMVRQEASVLIPSM